MRLLPRLGWGALAAVVVPMLLPVAAAAEPVPTPQAAAMNAAWVEGLTAADMAPQRAVTCIVDTGALVTPDTPATSPSGPIVARVGLGSLDADPGPADANHHGTFMASAAIAPRNAWGTVGLEPAGQVIMVRAQADAQSGFYATAVQQGINECILFAQRIPGYRVASISLSLGQTSTVTQSQAAVIDDGVDNARQYGIAVVAAAGNAAGSPTQYPASAANVLAVGAGNTAGGLCSYASFDSRTNLVAPACGILEATDLSTGAAQVDNGGGSSTATVLVAQAITTLCDLVPGLTGVQAQAALQATAVSRGGALVPDLAAAARSVGAGALVDRGNANLPASSSTGGTTSATPDGAAQGGSGAVNQDTGGKIVATPARLKVHGTAALWQARKGRRSGTLTVSITGRASGQQLRVSVYAAGRSEFTAKRVARATKTASRISFKLSSKPGRVTLVLLPKKGSTSLASLGVSVRIIAASSAKSTEFRR